MKNIYEQIIESLVNDDEARARELFHQEVVRQSREIYNNLISEEAEEEEEEEEEDMEESMSLDHTDDMMSDVRADEEGMDMDDDGMGGDDMGHEMGDEMGGEGDLEDRVVDLEDALDDLKAEFDRLMADEAGEEEHDDMDLGGDDDMGGEEEFGSEEDDEELDDSIMREYIEKVAHPGNTEGKGVGAGTVGGSTNAKSIVAGKNDMGGTAKNIAQGSEKTNPDGTAAYKKPSNAYAKGDQKMPGSGSYENVPGAKAGKAFSNAKKPVTKDAASGTHSPVAKN